jgi:folylpolyglutamate synthase/dihydropteroate synthase
VPLVESISRRTFPPGVPQWFELVSLLAFVTFARAASTGPSSETGLGGRLDATNVLDPEASVITPIGSSTRNPGDTI